MSERLVGTNYITPDLLGKITGRARYAEDFRAEGMLFCKLLLSPRPHARVRGMDTRAALALPGVKAILTADDLPDLGGAERALTNEPVYGGGVSELACDHQGLAMHVRVVVASAEEIVVRRYEKDGASTDGADALKNVRDLTRLPVPACARFSSEIAQTSDL